MSNIGSETSAKSSRSSNEKLVPSGKSHIGSEAASKNNDREKNDIDENDKVNEKFIAYRMRREVSVL